MRKNWATIQPVYIADKLDNICATFSRGLAPTGSQDPYALRRQALGIINILLDGNYHVSLYKVIAGALYLLNIPAEDTKKLVPQIAEFMKQRLRNMLMDQGIRYDVVDAVLADQMNDDFTDLVARAKALNSFVASAEAPALIQAATVSVKGNSDIGILGKYQVQVTIRESAAEEPPAEEP